MFDTTTSPYSEAEIQNLVADEIARRKDERQLGAKATTAAGGAAMAGKTAVHVDLLNELFGEFDDIRNDPARRQLQGDQMERTYQNYLDQGMTPLNTSLIDPERTSGLQVKTQNWG